MIRLPDDLADWIAKLARRNGGSVSTEIARHFRQLMDADAKVRADRSPTGE
jgi:hypothetical protein